MSGQIKFGTVEEITFDEFAAAHDVGWHWVAADMSNRLARTTVNRVHRIDGRWYVLARTDLVYSEDGVWEEGYTVAIVPPGTDWFEAARGMTSRYQVRESVARWTAYLSEDLSDVGPDDVFAYGLACERLFWKNNRNPMKKIKENTCLGN